MTQRSNKNVRLNRRTGRPLGWRKTCRDYLKRNFGTRGGEVVEEYIGEAEHQDGYGYWDQFPNLLALRTDFLLYVKMSRGA